MRISRAVILATGTSLLTLASPAFGQAAVSALPQEDGTHAAASVTDIIVTARRRTESMQSVPVAVTAITPQELERRSARDIVDLASVAPNLQIGQSSRGGSVANVNLRGQENTGGALTNDPAVGIYFDEVYLGRSAGSLLSSIQDMASVQVLRGPQGTLFGRNNTGGAIVLTPNRPGLEGFHGSVNFSYGSFDRFEYGGVIDIPLVEDKLGVRASFTGVRQDGIGRSLFTGIDDFGNRHRDSGRIAVRWKPSDTATIDFTYDRTRVREAGPMTAPLGLTAGTAALPIGLRYYENRASVTPLSNADVKGYTLRGEFEMAPDMNLKVILGRRLLSTVQDNDLENGPAVTGSDPRQAATQNQWTAEVQLSGTTLQDAADWLNALNYTAGIFYFDERGTDSSQVPNISTALVTGRTLQNFAQNRSAAGYVQVESQHFDKLFLTFGTRYTKDDRDLRIRTTNNGVCSLLALPAGTPIPVCFQTGSASFDYFSFATGVRYQFSQNANIYLKYDKAQRAGGLDDTPTSIEAFQPEVVNSFELGAKLDLLERRLRLNLALFNARIDNVQRVSLLVASGVPYASVFNAAKSTTRGVEAEVTAVPVDGLTLSGSFGYNDAHYNRFRDPRPSSAAVVVNGVVTQPAVVNGADISSFKFPNTPKFTWSLSGTYEAPIEGIGSLLLRADYSHRSHVFFDTFNNPYVAQKAYGILNGRIQLDLDPTLIGTGVSVALYGRNLTNTKFSTYGSTAAGGFLIRADQRRAYGVEVKALF